MDIKEILFELGNILGLENIKLNENGATRLVFDDKLAVNIQYDTLSEALALTSDFASLTDGAPQHLFENLLEIHSKSFPPSLNHFAIADDPRRIVFHTKFETDDLEVSKFVKHLESFVNELEEWDKLYNEGRFSEAPDGKGKPSPNDFINSNNVEGMRL